LHYLHPILSRYAIRSLTLAGAVFLAACSSSNSNPEPTQNPNNGANDTTATYRITFNSTWSAASHPVQYPTGAAHFSGLVGAVHNDQVVFWEPGQIATDGIERMAETGGKSIFLTEVTTAIDSGYAISAIDGPGVARTPGNAVVEVDVSADYPNVTLTTMLAPSPDWFTGFHGVKLYENGAFVQSMTISAVVFDSGTDNGVTFVSSNSDTQPRGIIETLTSDPADSSFMQGLPNVGQFVIERL